MSAIQEAIDRAGLMNLPRVDYLKTVETIIYQESERRPTLDPELVNMACDIVYELGTLGEKSRLIDPNLFMLHEGEGTPSKLRLEKVFHRVYYEEMGGEATDSALSIRSETLSKLTTIKYRLGQLHSLSA